MSTTKSAATGSFSPVSQGTVRTDAKFDLENLSDEEREVVTADEFIIYGKASIEQWNDPAPGEEHLYIEMDALEQRLDQLLALDNLSRRHDDVKVGEFRDEYTLDEATTVHLDNDETLRFDAGDTLQTQVIREGEPLPDGSGEAEEDALWLVANVYGRENAEGSVISQETRLGAYYGQLDGFSVTVYTREYQQAEKGRVATEVDFMAVTIGEDELIKNKGSHFGVAEFQALFGTAPEADDATSITRRLSRRPAEDLGDAIGGKLTVSIFDNIFGNSRDSLVAETIQVAQQQEKEIDAAASEVVSDESDADHIAEQAEDRLKSIADRLEQEEMDRDDLAAEVADELGMDVEEIHALFEELEAAQAAQEDGPDDEPEDDPEDPEDDPDEQSGVGEEDIRNMVQEEVQDAVSETVQDELGDIKSQLEDDTDSETDEQSEYVTQDEFDERMESLGQQLEESVEDIGETVADNIEQQMQTGGTPDPSGGSATDESDIKEEVDDVVDSMTFGDE